MTKTCQEPDCDGPYLARGWCPMHYARWKRGAEVPGPRLRKPKFDGSGEPPVAVTASGCWEWQGSIDDNGYGTFMSVGKRHNAHRWMYEREIGPIPEGLPLDHLCRNRACVNPQHLEPVTTRENLRRGEAPNWRAYRENRCTKGHPYTPENTRVASNGTRQCRACAARKERARRRRLAEEREREREMFRTMVYDPKADPLYDHRAATAARDAARWAQPAWRDLGARPEEDSA